MLICQGDIGHSGGEACVPVEKVSTSMSPGSTGGRNGSTRAARPDFVRGVTRCREAASNFPDKERGTMGLKKKQQRQKRGRKSLREEEGRRPGVDMDTGRRVSVLWTSDLQVMREAWGACIE